MESDEMFDLSQENVIVHRAMLLYRVGGCSYDKALESAVIALCRANKDITDMATKVLMNSPVALPMSETNKDENKQ